MKPLKWIAGTVSFIVMLLLAVPLFISLDDYVSRIEQSASGRLHEPVNIGRIRLAAMPLPLPHVILGPIHIGTNEELAISEVVVNPDVLSLLTDVKVIRSIVVRDMTVAQHAIDKLPLVTASGSAEAAKVHVRRIVLDNVTLKLKAGTVGPLEGDIAMDDAGRPAKAVVRTRDGRLTATLATENGGYRIDASAKAWIAPLGPAVLYDELKILGSATPAGVMLDEVSARLYGGTLKGSVSASWEKGAQAKGTFDVRQIELDQVVRLFSPTTRVSGRLSAKPVFSAAAADVSRLADALRLETPFNVESGVLYGVDLTKAATVLLKEGSRGGETRFDTLSGHLMLERGHYRVSQLKIVSGSLSADGAVTISDKKELAGRINATVKAAALASATVPLNVSGTLQSPVVLPSASYLAGAVAGTAVMGPGVGTSVGRSLGRMVEGLFGSRQESAKNP